MVFGRMKPLNSKSALAIKAAAIVLATLAVYNQDLAIIANEALRSELMSYVLAVPFLFTYLIYRKRKMLRAAIPFESPTTRKKTAQTHRMVGGLLCLLAFLLYWYGSYTFYPLEHHMISLTIFTAGLVLTIFNLETLRVLAFPITFLLFLVPPPLEFVYAAGTALSTISSGAAYTVLRGVGLPVTLTSQYETPIIVLTKPGSAPLSFAVDIACGGLYSLTGFTIFAVFVAYIARGALWRKAAILVAGFPLIYALNIIRTVIIVLIGWQYGMEVAMQVFHVLGDWGLIFTGALILLAISEKGFKIQLFTMKRVPTTCKYCAQNLGSKQNFCVACGRILNSLSIDLSRNDLSKIAILAVAAILIIDLQVPVFALTEGPAEVTIQNLGGQETVAQILPEVPGYTTEFVYRDKTFEERAKQDASLSYVYRPANTSEKKIWVTIEVAKTRSSLHRWEVCLVTWPLTRGHQLRVTQLSLRDVQILQNPPVTARYFAFHSEKANITQVVLYWYENSYFNTGYSLENKHVKISLIAFADKGEDVSFIEKQLLSFAKPIVNYWQPIRTWSEIALLISRNGMILIAITIASIAVLSIYEVIMERMEKKSNLQIYNKLALPEEKLILQSTHLAAQKETPTASAIALHYEEISGKPIKLNVLLRKLNEAEEARMIRRGIASRDDEPVIIWNSEIYL